MKILVTGVAGQLGFDICRELKERGYTDVLGIDREELDITDEQAVEKFILEYKPDVVMHNAAWTAVDKAEEMEEACYKVNVLGTRYIAEASQKIGAKLVYISTDYVFNGEGENFFEVDDEKSPLSVYGKTKHQGELEAQKCEKHFIVRISWVFGINGNNFVKTMLKLAETKSELNVVCDQIGSPTYTYDLSKLLCDMIETEKYGVYHATNEGTCSWYEFAKTIFEVAGVEIKVNPVTTAEYPASKAKRPLNSRMSKASLDLAGFERLPTWQSALERYVNNELEVNKKKPKVAVIMSTYNGEKFLKEQIDTILAQTDVELDLYVFDDCSKDNTVNIIKEYQEKYKNIFLTINEKNKNFTYNFLDGLFSFKDNDKYDFYAFADQDDYWMPNKIISAIGKIKETGDCALYSSNLKIVDQDLNYNGYNMKSLKYKNRHYDVLCKNIVTGCTMVIDKKFKNLATKYYPNNIYLHDYWLALIANYCKEAHFIYDTNPEYILYRQHGNNLIGSKEEFWIKRIARIMLRPIDQARSTHRLVNEFFKLYSNELLSSDYKIFSKIVDYRKLKNKFNLFFNIKSNYSFMFKIKILFGKY